MGRLAKQRLPFDKQGGVIAIQRRMLDSEIWLRLSPQAKVLMFLLQIHWRPDRPIGFGIREAITKIPCARVTAINMFKELESSGFIVMVDESLFCSRTKSKARTWRLTWLPFMDKPPTNDWKNGNGN